MSARTQAAAAPAQQPQLPLGLLEEDPDYLTRQLVTYIGNKRALLGLIRSAVEDVRRRTGQDKLRILDAFSGSGVVSRMLKQYAGELVVNDTEDYARIDQRVLPGQSRLGTDGHARRNRQTRSTEPWAPARHRRDSSGACMRRTTRTPSGPRTVSSTRLRTPIASTATGSSWSTSRRRSDRC